MKQLNELRPLKLEEVQQLTLFPRQLTEIYGIAILEINTLSNLVTISIEDYVKLINDSQMIELSNIIINSPEERREIIDKLASEILEPIETENDDSYRAYMMRLLEKINDYNNSKRETSNS